MERYTPPRPEKIEQSFARFCEDRPEERTVYFKDIVTNERIQPGEVPACIREQDPMCAQGLATLRRLGAQNINLAFMFGPHGKPKDFTDLLEDPAAHEALWQAPCVAIEANMGNESGGILAEPENTGRGAFQRAQLRWLRARDKLILPCDIDTPEDPKIAGGTLRRTMIEVFNLQDHVDQSTLPGDTKKRLSSLNTLYYHLIREEMMLGQLGFWVHELEKRDALPTGTPLSLPFMLGGLHRAIAQKAAAHLGASPRVYEAEPPGTRAVLFSHIARQGYATYDQLDAFALAT